jgi:monovalent cation/hydrogen antiporter
MTFFESLLLLMLGAIILLQVARHLLLPYPALLAGAGVVLALIPGAPVIAIEPETYLALFIAPVLVDAAYDFPPGATRRFLAPLITFAVLAVALVAGAVAWISHAVLGLPIAAGLALGAIVAPPDAAAATAVLRSFSIPRNANAVLQGESLFNDSTALLLFSGALAVLASHGLHAGVALREGAAVPGGILFGIVFASLGAYASRFVVGTLGGNLLQFVMSYAVWILASHLKLSAVLATVAFAMTMANKADAAGIFAARMRVQSYAVWSAVVFALNAFAFMLMGMQARTIVSRMDPTRFHGALGFAALIVAAVIVVRMVVVLAFYRLDAWWEEAHGRQKNSSLAQAVFVGWCGMRGFVTMATALALPQGFPQRDIVVLTAFGVVLATLVFQGLTLGPLIRLLRLDRGEAMAREVKAARGAIARAAVARLGAYEGSEAENLRYRFALIEESCFAERGAASLQHLRELGMQAVLAERRELERIRLRNEISIATYLALQEQIDWVELTMLNDNDRKIEEI